MKNAKALFTQFVEDRSQDIPDEISLDDILDLLQDNEELQFFTSSTLEDDGNIVNKASWGVGTPVFDELGDQVDFHVRFGGPASSRVDWDNVEQEQIRCRLLPANDTYTQDAWYLTAVRNRVGTEISNETSGPKKSRSSKYAENAQPELI